MLLSFVTVFAQDIRDSTPLKTLLENVVENPLLRAKNTQSQALREQKKAIYGEYLPKLTLGYAFENTTNPDIFYPKRIDGAFLEAQWLLFDGLKREGKLKIIEHQLKAKESLMRSTKNQLELNIIQEYFSALRMESKLLALKHQQNQLQESIVKYEKFYAVGLTSLDTLEAIKAQNYQNAYTIESAKLALKAHLQQLSLLSGVEITTLNADTKLQEISLETPQQIREDLQANYYATQASQSEKSQHTYFPTITLSNRYTRYNYHQRNLPMLPFEIPLENPSYQNSFGVSVRFTLFDSLATFRARESAHLNALAANFEYAYLKDAQNKELIIAKEALRSAKDKITWAQSGLKSASIAYSYAKEKFDAQLIDSTQYLNTLTTLFNAQSFYDEARFDYEVKKAEFLYKNGNTLTDFVD